MLFGAAATPSMTSSPHNASSSALGYLYQTQWPLLELVRRFADQPDAAVTLELHDDVALEDATKTPTELLQLKHHPASVRTLRDKDSDWWRTIRAWMAAGPAGAPDGPTLTMVTTLVAEPDTAAWHLRPASRTPAVALRKLEDAARESREQQFVKVREAFLAMPDGEREIFVSRMHVLDASPTIDDLDAQLRRSLGPMLLPASHEDTFMERLWGWWHGLAVEMLRGRVDSVRALDVRAFVDDLRGQFAPDNLPLLVGPEDVRADVAGDHSERAFVAQLEWVGAPSVILQQAIIDYYQAYAQTVRWLDDDLIGLHEIEDFERRLVREWQQEFAFMVAELGTEADETTKRRAGLRLLRQALNQTTVRVRERFTDPFYARGKHHELADGGSLGWHPDFEDRLKAMLLEAA